MSLTHDEQICLYDILFVFAVTCILGYIILMIMVLFGRAKIMGMY